MMKRFWVLLLVFILALSSCTSTDPCANPGDPACTRVLFIGNSYIFVNDLPEMFAELAVAGRHPELVAFSAQGGWNLAEHVGSKESMNLLSSEKWNYVVLQEQSQIPSVRQLRTRKMYPAARTLVKKISDEGATPLFFLTWGHRYGWPEQGMFDYESMQEQVNQGYEQIAQELHVPIAPVGYAWQSALEQYPDINLWQEDNTHPTEEGTYLAACVFYAVIFHESPVGLSYRAGLSKDQAARLQKIASETVLNIQ